MTFYQLWFGCYPLKRRQLGAQWTQLLNKIVAFIAWLFEADLRHRGRLNRQGTPIKLQEQPFRILALLLETPGEVLSARICEENLGRKERLLNSTAA